FTSLFCGHCCRTQAKKRCQDADGSDRETVGVPTSPFPPARVVFGRNGSSSQCRWKKKRCQDPFLLTFRALSVTMATMGRALRAALGGYVYHALNRGNSRATVFHKDGDYEAFERVMVKALEHTPGMRLLAYCLMPNHW